MPAIKHFNISKNWSLKEFLTNLFHFLNFQNLQQAVRTLYGLFKVNIFELL